MKTQLFQVRRYIKTDLDQLIDIDWQVIPQHVPALTKKQLENICEHKSCVCLVVEDGDSIVAFAIYQFFSDCIQIIRLCISPDFRRERIASSLIEIIIVQLGAGREYVLCEVPEHCLDVQLLLKQHGFKATSFLNEGDEVTLVMIYEPELV